MKLYDLQKQFMNVIAPTLTLSREYTREGAREFCSLPRLRTLWGTGGRGRVGEMQPQNVELRLQIYRDSSLNGRLKALRNIFHSSERMVGEQFFAQMATEFLKQPSQYLTADAQGEQFPDFIANYSAATTLPYLSDLAKLEWLWYQVFHSHNNAVRFMQSNYPVTQLWEMCQAEYCGDFVVQDLSEPLKVMLIQREQRIHMRHVTQEEWDTLQL